jgi:hypothetical protein
VTVPEAGILPLMLVPVTVNVPVMGTVTVLVWALTIVANRKVANRNKPASIFIGILIES